MDGSMGWDGIGKEQERIRMRDLERKSNKDEEKDRRKTKVSIVIKMTTQKSTTEINEYISRCVRITHITYKKTDEDKEGILSSRKKKKKKMEKGKTRSMCFG